MVVERGKEWESELLEVCAASGGGRHGAECLGACMRWRGRATRVWIGRHWLLSILTVNRIADRLFHELFAWCVGIKRGRASFVVCRQSKDEMELDMNRFKEDEVVQENAGVSQPAGDGIDRRNFLGCMAWAGTGLLWSMVGGVPASKLLAQTMKGGARRGGKVEDFSFVQISDSHIGFNKGANPDVTGTLQKAIDKINVVPAGVKAPDFMIHTGDITQNSKAAEFDTASQVIKGAKMARCSTFRASTILSTMVRCTSSVSAKAAWAMAGTATTTRAFTLWG